MAFGQAVAVDGHHVGELGSAFGGAAEEQKRRELEQKRPHRKVEVADNLRGCRCNRQSEQQAQHSEPRDVGAHPRAPCLRSWPRHWTPPILPILGFLEWTNRIDFVAGNLLVIKATVKETSADFQGCTPPATTHGEPVFADVASAIVRRMSFQTLTPRTTPLYWTKSRVTKVPGLSREESAEFSPRMLG